MSPEGLDLCPVSANGIWTTGRRRRGVLLKHSQFIRATVQYDRMQTEEELATAEVR